MPIFPAKIWATTPPKPAIEPMRRRKFTLIEIVAVLAIMLLVGVLVIGRFGKTPALAAAANAASRLERIFNSAVLLSTRHGKMVEIAFYQDDNRFQILPWEGTDPANESADQTWRDGLILRRQYEYRASGGIRFQLVPDPGETTGEDNWRHDGWVVAQFYPDGSASASEIRVVSGGHQIKLTLSALTGELRREEVPEDEMLSEAQ